jgi:DNA polymerase IV (DinB-like DNA polymerase)
MMDWKYVILHVDLDCFFASVHVKYHPFLRGYPVIIGADPKNGKGRGVISTCSYEARKYGLHSAMPISQAFKQCPRGIYICSGKEISFSVYYEESEKVMKILREYSEKFQAAGIDEAYLDVTNNWKDYGSTPRSIAEEIQVRIYKELTLSVSIGIAESKSIAKIASDLNKPNGISLVNNSELEEKLYHLPTHKIVGIGKKTEQFLLKKGIKTIGEIANLSRERIFMLLGQHGLYLRKIALGLNFREVGYFHGGRKSIGSERTFVIDQNNWQFIQNTIKNIISRLVEDLNKHSLLCRTVTIKIRFQGYITYTRSHSFNNYIAENETIFITATKLFEEFYDMSKKVRLVGVRLSSLKKNNGQLCLTPFLKIEN